MSHYTTQIALTTMIFLLMTQFKTAAVFASRTQFPIQCKCTEITSCKIISLRFYLYFVTSLSKTCQQWWFSLFTPVQMWSEIHRSKLQVCPVLQNDVELQRTISSRKCLLCTVNTHSVVICCLLICSVVSVALFK